MRRPAMSYVFHRTMVFVMLLRSIRTAGGHVTGTLFNIVQPGGSTNGKIGTEMAARSRVECSIK